MKTIFLKDLKSILYSSHGNIQFGVLYDPSIDSDIDSGTVEYLVETYPDVVVTRLQAYESELIFYVEGVDAVRE